MKRGDLLFLAIILPWGCLYVVGHLVVAMYRSEPNLLYISVGVILLLIGCTSFGLYLSKRWKE